MNTPQTLPVSWPPKHIPNLLMDPALIHSLPDAVQPLPCPPPTVSTPRCRHKGLLTIIKQVTPLESSQFTPRINSQLLNPHPTPEALYQLPAPFPPSAVPQTTSLFQPQDLCTCCFLLPGMLFPELSPGQLFLFFQVSAQSHFLRKAPNYA